MPRVETAYLQGCGPDVGGEFLRLVGERLEGSVEHASVRIWPLRRGRTSGSREGSGWPG
jgi:hypothetical protein